MTSHQLCLTDPLRTSWQSRALCPVSPSHVLPPGGDTPAFHASTAGFLPKGPVLALVITQHLLDLV